MRTQSTTNSTGRYVGIKRENYKVGHNQRSADLVHNKKAQTKEMPQNRYLALGVLGAHSFYLLF